MKLIIVLALVLGMAPLHQSPAEASVAGEESSPREKLLMDFGWKFHLGDDWGTGEELINLGISAGPAKPGFNDSSWSSLDLPHDWAVALPFDRNANGDEGFKPRGPGFPQNSVGWYRRTFILPAADAGQRLWLDFGGIYRDSLIYLNGCLIGRHQRGYNSFRYDITDVANCGGKNVLAIRVDASKFEGWFYEGAGIYRHVWLWKTSPLAVAPDGTFVYSKFPNNVPQGPAQLDIETKLDNFQTNIAGAEVLCEVLDPHGKVVATSTANATLDPGASAEVKQKTSVSAPLLWSPETPQLYQLVTTVRSAGEVVDRTETEFGIRTLAFDVNRGFLLNGQPYVIKGTCNHQDHAGVGWALPDALQNFRIAKLKELGDNSIRTAHNEPAAELLEACDRLGMLVMDECRTVGSDADNLAEVEFQIRRDHNHPSVFIWSIGNEEPIQNSPLAARVARTEQNLVHRLDPSRQVTYAASVGDEFTGINSVTDVRGWNYHVGADMDDYHREHPAQPSIGTETASTMTTRGIYSKDPARGYQSAYDSQENRRDGNDTAESWWSFYAARPWLCGGFVWAGFDYRGETAPYGWPCISSHYGVLDTCGFPKDNFYYYQSVWTDKPMVHLLPHWNWPGREGQAIDVWCYSNCQEVELFLNGQSLGRKPLPKYSHLEWQVPYAPGTLVAKGYEGENVVAETNVETTGEPAAIQLNPDRATINADGEDCAVITVAVTDTQGRPVPAAGNLVHFAINGPGKIIGVGNGDPSCHEPDQYAATNNIRSLALTNWRMKLVPNSQDCPEIASDFADSDWPAADVNSEQGPLAPDTSAVYREHVSIPTEALAGGAVLHVGMIDDNGWVYVNGQLAGESHDWQASPSFDVQKLLHPGENVIAVVVQNKDGSGGLNKGVNLELTNPPTAPVWQRSVFNGLAQIIVQSIRKAGDIRLTAHSDGLAETTTVIHAEPHSPRPALP